MYIQFFDAKHNYSIHFASIPTSFIHHKALSNGYTFSLIKQKLLIKTQSEVSFL